MCSRKISPAQACGPRMSLTLGMSFPCVPWFGFSSCLSLRSPVDLRFGLYVSLCISTPVSPSAAIVLGHSANLCLYASVIASLSVSVCCCGFQPSPSVVVASVSLSWCPPAPGPGHPPESAPPVSDDPRHGRLLLCLHAPRLDAPQLHCLRLWTLAGQRHGESGLILAEA